MTEANRLCTVDLFETSCILQVAHKDIRRACLGHGCRVGLSIQGHFKSVHSIQMLCSCWESIYISVRISAKPKNKDDRTSLEELEWWFMAHELPLVEFKLAIYQLVFPGRKKISLTYIEGGTLVQPRISIMAVHFAVMHHKSCRNWLCFGQSIVQFSVHFITPFCSHSKSIAVAVICLCRFGFQSENLSIFLFFLCDFGIVINHRLK